MSTAAPFKIFDKDSRLVHRFTPWDYKSIYKKTNEITEIYYNDPFDLYYLFEEYEKFCIDRKVDMSFVRIPFKDEQLRKFATQEGFVFTEMSYTIYKALSANKDDYKEISKKNLKVSDKLKNKKQLYEICSSAFFHGRFAEDLQISKQNSTRRFANWSKDLLKNNTNALYLYNKNKLIGFMFYEVSDKKCKLILGGMDSKFSYLAPAFWSHVFYILKENGIKSVETTISAANIGVINLYNIFKFKFRDCLMGYHKHYKNIS